jgi:hypothetical protein
MNKALPITLLMALLITAAHAQLSKPIVPDNVKILHPGGGYLNSINTKAIRNFVGKYEKATDVAWYAVKNGFIVRFLIDSIFARSAYKKNGQWVYTIKQYMENGMPRDVRHTIKSTYYDYSIVLVEEIWIPDEPVKYLVHMQDSISWKNVLVSNGQMDLVEDRKKL